MIATHVRYTVNADYAEQNKANIRRVMEEIRSLGRTDIQYSVFVEDDGKTFNHWPLFASEEARKVFIALASFKAFQSGLQEGLQEGPPRANNLTLVGSSVDVF